MHSVFMPYEWIKSAIFNRNPMILPKFENSVSSNNFNYYYDYYDYFYFNVPKMSNKIHIHKGQGEKPSHLPVFKLSV